MEACRNIEIYAGIITAIFGLVFGSFLNCTAMRVARGEDFVHGRSRCRSCGHELAAPDLIPVFSFLITGGRCRYCKEKISIRYPITEVIFMLLLLGLYIAIRPFDIYGAVPFKGLMVLFLRNAFFTGCLFTLSLVDMEKYEIPDMCLIIGLIAWIVTAPFVMADIKDALIHMAAGAGCGAFFLVMSLIMDRVLGRESLGGGDIKLFALSGLYLGLIPTYAAVLIACMAGLVPAVIKKRREKKGTEADEHIPFAPSIAAATYIMLIFGDKFAAWYLAAIFYG